MQSLILRLHLASHDLATIRKHARETAGLVGLEGLQQARMATAVSEIARNARDFAGGGMLEFRIEPSDTAPQGQCLVAQVSDDGPGIRDIDAAVRGVRLPSGRMSSGLAGSWRLVDRMSVVCPPPGGTVVRMEIDLPRGARTLSPADVQGIAAEIARRQPASPLQELEEQNRELLKIHQELRDKQAALEQADERKNQFVKTLVHELRTPLSTLDMNLALLRRKPELAAAELLARCEVMGRQTAQLTKLVDELMDAASVSQGKVQLRKAPSELNALVTSAVEMSGAAVAAKAHDLKVHLSGEPLWVEADATRLRQVICNLLQNSARYTPTRGVIEIDVARADNRAVVKVMDNGIGIPSDLLPHVFELFVQGEAKPPGSEGGLGIGLTLVHHLVARHGGEVDVASDGPDKGSTFTVTLPLIPKPAG
ncbi:sensor histidine kinase [Ramlibacter ginsenosidimutans]|uniref:histidine kinase n=1 Tax=Ramlibacter ginsenosidimutans TaxID=502333 RepID=A0A934TUV9_9BURK|nr:sensor histidine kinase [Ramlibacter ginsenosidimutans]MBK6007285.1 sensor histidine kinase [Ramlibacter ginsenosidimutans]